MSSQSKNKNKRSWIIVDDTNLLECKFNEFYIKFEKITVLQNKYVRRKFKHSCFYLFIIELV